MITKTILFKHTRWLKDANLRCNTTQCVCWQTRPSRTVQQPLPLFITAAFPQHHKIASLTVLIMEYAKINVTLKIKSIAILTAVSTNPVFYLYFLICIYLRNGSNRTSTAWTENVLIPKNKTVFNIIRTAHFVLTIRILFTKQLHAQVCLSRGSDAFRSICQFHRSSQFL